MIAEDMFMQNNSDGNAYLLLDEIIDYQKNNRAMAKEDRFTISKNDRKAPKITNASCDLLVK